VTERGPRSMTGHKKAYFRWALPSLAPGPELLAAGAVPELREP